MAFPPKIPTIPDPKAIVNGIAGALGLVPPLVDPSNSPPGNISDFNPLNTGQISPSLQDSDLFFNWPALDGLNFRKIFSYQLVIMDGSKIRALSFIIPPSSINYSVPAASNLSVTLNGILEESNGAPLRQISIAGTTGVYNKESKPAKQQDNIITNVLGGAVDYLFRNSINAVNRAITDVNRAVSAFTGNAQQTSNELNYSQNDLTTPISATQDSALKHTGHYFIHSFMRFLDYYLALKKTKEGRNVRLKFLNHKDQMFYDVILNNYSVNKPAGSIEYNYTLNLTAYRRAKKLDLEGLDSETKLLANQADRVNLIQGIVNGLRASRKALATSISVLRGIRQDVEDALFTPFRELNLLISDIKNISLSAADFPNSVIQDMKQPTLSLLKDPNRDFSDLRNSVNDAISEHGIQGNPATTGSLPLTDYLSNIQADGKSETSSRDDNASPIEKIFKDPVKFVSVFEQVPIDQLNLPSEVQASLNAEVERVRNLSDDDLKQRRDSIVSFIGSVSEALGGGSNTYNRIKGLTPPKKTFKKLSTEDIELLSTMNDLLIAYDKTILMLRDREANVDNDYYTFYADYARNNGLEFQSSASKYYVPFPYGATLDQLSLQYLGDSNRWLEIAAINGLREPYIDEEGFDIPLISPGSGASVNVASVDNLYVGQIVTVLSNTKLPKTKKIRAIDQLNEASFIVQFEGAADLQGFLVSDNARIHAYLPNTVNSTKLIAIPSPDPVNVPGQIKTAPGVEDLNGLAQIAKMDFLLQSDGDLIISSSGDTKFATGLANLVQAATLKLRTRQGELLQHPDYGNPIQAGSSVAEIDARFILSSLNSQFQKDGRFGPGIVAGSVKLEGPATVVKLLLGIANTDVNLPIVTNLPL